MCIALERLGNNLNSDKNIIPLLIRKGGINRNHVGLLTGLVVSTHNLHTGVLRLKSLEVTW